MSNEMCLNDILLTLIIFNMKNIVIFLYDTIYIFLNVILKIMSCYFMQEHIFYKFAQGHLQWK